jgi:hypothetical protein
MGLILGILAIVAGAIGIKYSVVAIIAGITAITAFFGIKRD